MNEVYKAQLKAIHYLGKGFKSEIEFVWRETIHKVNELKLQYATDFPKVDGIFKKVKEEKRKVEKLDGSIATMSSTITKLTNQVAQQIAQNNEANAMVKLMWKNQYGDKLPSEVHVHSLSKFEVERLQAQSLSSFKAAHLNDKVDRLEKEVAELKTENTYLRETLNSMSSKMDDQASTTNDILLQQ